jgi:hypothetical protein
MEPDASLVAESFDPAPAVVFDRRVSLSAPGTPFPVVRVASHCQGDGATPYARLQCRASPGDPLGRREFPIESNVVS